MNKEQILQLIEQELVQADEAQTDTDLKSICMLYTCSHLLLVLIKVVQQ